jgi:hypothetical protein
MNTCKSADHLDYEFANQLCNELWEERGDSQIGLSETHLAITGEEWDGESKSKFNEIIETFEELFKTIVSIDIVNETVNLVGAVEE